MSTQQYPPPQSTQVDPGFKCPLVISNLVRWYEMYADDLMCRETGIGIIVAATEHLWPSGHVTYRVLCENEEVRIFPRRHLKFLF